MLFRSDGFVANSEAVRADTIRREGLSPDRVVVIPNALPPHYQSGPGRSEDEERGSGAEPVVLCVANLIAYKGHADLLEACARLGRQGLTIRLVLVGEGPLRGELQAKAARLGLEVDFAGSRTDVHRWLRAADVFVLPSLEEGMSNALMEALGAGLPAVATDVGGNSEVVGDAGLLCRPGEPADLAAKLGELLRCPSLRQQLSLAAALRAGEQFGYEVMIDRHRRYYEGLVHAKEPPCAA